MHRKLSTRRVSLLVLLDLRFSRPRFVPTVLSFVFVGLAMIALGSCASQSFVKEDGGALVAVSATSSGMMSKGFGMLVTIQNLDTKAVYASRSLSPISPHSVIQNVPAGQYLVRKVVVPVGNITFSNWSEDIPAFFGEITIQANAKHYLGNFSGKQKIGFKNILRMELADEAVPEKLVEILSAKAGGWSSGEFVKSYPVGIGELIVY